MLRALFQTPDITPPPSEGAKTAVGCKERENKPRDHTRSDGTAGALCAGL